MAQATDGNFYGVANPNSGGGVTSLYKVTLKGVFSTLYLFDGTIGTHPAAPLVQHTDGLLYGDTTTGTGTGQSNGIFYSWSIGAAPFLRLALTSGKAGTLVGMFGQGFDTASVVKFGGVAATSITLTGSTYTVATRGSSHWQSHRNHGLDHAHQLADLYRARFLDQRRRDADSSLWSCHWGRRNQSVCSGRRH